ncbi:MAG TPA: LuxR C-terminal-related transcriptional regulator [Propionibacteriaceae bacterium]|jgi:Bacterial regulatory proteins, luxR family|nr:LuxR C-terminal-related transcriptional regulator [Propionibacteriaceae bacterium]
MRRGSRSSPESEQRRRDSTLDIADYLKISVHTVQSHLRNIFTKPEYAPRCDLVTKIFFAHYEPRLRDNEQRTAANLPLRGGPAGAHSPHRRPGRAQAEPATK